MKKKKNFNRHITHRLRSLQIFLFRFLPVMTAVLVIVFFLFYKGILLFNNPSTKKFPVRGIDVSHHQGPINWKKIYNVDFVFIKASEGGDYIDPEFRLNWRGAAKAGIPHGAYHFFTFCRSGQEQAQNFMRVFPADEKSLMPVIDLEFMGQCKNSSADFEVIKEINVFLKEIERNCGRKPMIYTTYEFYDRYLVGQFPEYAIWIRDVFFTPRMPDGRKWRFWQYSNRGTMPGIDGFVDLNVFNGSREEFKSFYFSE